LLLAYPGQTLEPFSGKKKVPTDGLVLANNRKGATLIGQTLQMLCWRRH